MQALGGIVGVIVGDDGLVGSVLRLCLRHQTQCFSCVDGGLGAGDAALFELALGFAGGAFCAVGVAGGLPGSDLGGGLAGYELAVDVPGPFPGLAVLIGFGELAAETLWKLLKSGEATVRSGLNFYTSTWSFFARRYTTLD